LDRCSGREFVGDVQSVEAEFGLLDFMQGIGDPCRKWKSVRIVEKWVFGSVEDDPVVMGRLPSEGP